MGEELDDDDVEDDDESDVNSDDCTDVETNRRRPVFACHRHDLYIRRQSRNFVPYLRQLVLAATLWVKLLEMFVVT